MGPIRETSWESLNYKLNYKGQESVNHRIKRQAFLRWPLQIIWAFKPPSNKGYNYHVFYLYFVALFKKESYFRLGFLVQSFLFFFFLFGFFVTYGKYFTQKGTEISVQPKSEWKRMKQTETTNSSKAEYRGHLHIWPNTIPVFFKRNEGWRKSLKSFQLE